MDTLVGATRWVQSPAEQDDYMATELFFVRDHLGSPVLSLAAKKTLVSGVTYRYELQPVESYEYDPYGQPTVHVPATDGSPQSAGRLALKSMGSFAMTGAKSGDGFLDRNDIGRPNGSTGNTWTRTGAVPVAQSALGWNYLFTGRAWDADVRQYYIRHRWYEPLTGRWTAVDPISYRGGLNLYQYCDGNPLNSIDPHGLKKYRIGIRVDQPGAGGDRDCYEGVPGWNLDSGHTFIILDDGGAQDDSGGEDDHKTHSKGFYPGDDIDSPECGNPVAGEVRDDTEHDWDIGYDWEISEDQYNKARDFMLDTKDNPPDYDICSCNCTSWALECLKAAGIDLRTLRGSWPGGSGVNPGDLGEDLREDYPDHFRNPSHKPREDKNKHDGVNDENEKCGIIIDSEDK